jgi:hypothetical protein
MPSRGRGYLERARSIVVRAEARGGTLVAWGNSRLYFALDEAAIDDVIALATKPGEEGRVGEERFAFGVAQGPMEPLEPDGSRGELAWGHALVAAGALAMAARPGQVLLADRVKAVRSGHLVLCGGRFVEEAGLRLRGLALDIRQPWKRDAIASLGRLVEPPLLAAEGDGALVVKPGGYALVCAPRGLGGTRRLHGLAARYGDRAFVVRPSGSALEPLGALRRAMARAVAKELPPSLAPHASALESLLSSEPIALDVAQDVVSAYLAPRGPGQPPGVLLVDDAERVDPETLEVLGGAMRGPTPFPAVLRVLADADAPTAFAKGPPSATVTLQKLTEALAETLASAFTEETLDVEAKRRWSRLGEGSPLGILEAITHGLHSTELAWIGDRAFPRRKVSGRGKPRPAAHFVTLRAHQCPPASRAFLAAVALLGGEARVEYIGRMLASAEQNVVAESAAEELVRSRWLTVPEPGWVALPSRTHVDALSNILEPPLLLSLQRAAVDVFEGEGGFGKLEAVHHALASGDADRARRIVSTALLGLAQAKLTDAASRLRLLVNLPEREAREATDEHTHPGLVSKTGITPAMASTAAVQALLAPNEAPAPPAVEEAAPESEPTFVLMKPTGGTPAAGMPAVSVVHPASANPASDPTPSTQNPQARAAEKSVPVPADSEPPTIADMAPVLSNLTQLQRTLGAASDRPVKAAAPKPVLSLAEQIKAAIMSTNHDELERLLSTGQESSGEAFAERVRALSRLKRGEIGDALRVLRRVRHAPDASPSARCQTALSLGIAYAASSRFEESLLEGLTALARAREGGDPRGIHASLAFLARLYQGMARVEEAKQLREAAADITVST